MSLRPAILNPWFTPLSSLKGIGSVTLKAFLRLLPLPVNASIAVVRDLLFLAPYDVIDRRRVTSLAEAQLGDYVMLEVMVEAHYAPPTKRRFLPYRIAIADESGSGLLTFFHAKSDYLTRQFPEGKKRIIGGVVEMYDGMKQISHPDIVASPEQRDSALRLSPVYPLTAGLSQRVVQKTITAALALLKSLPEWGNADVISEHGWATFDAAIRASHAPKHPQDIELQSPSRMRLAYDEALANQLALLLMKQREQQQSGLVITPDTALHARFLATLPFALTEGQQQVIEQIFQDMSAQQRMVRLLQGDVGSGKTIVAMAAMLQVAAQGGQSALMAPTDILARQHAKTLQPIADAMGIRLQFLSGKMPTAEKNAAYQAIAEGSAQIVIGTHALFQQQVAFHALGLVVVDEQHRFGVEQRLSLMQKSVAPHLLQMTATPIPRSLTMTAYGDMDASVLKEKPAGRQAIDTRTVPLTRIDEVIAAIDRAVQGNHKIYWICPLIEASEDAPEAQELAAVEDRHRLLQHRFADRAVMVHGRMKQAEREQVMHDFAFGEAQILVATTVVEVGVNVPEATIMVIEQAERFGLAQLHQLRGRIGRGTAQSHCILLYDPRCSLLAKERLKTIRTSNDGFFIAEEDLRLRGAGDVLGTKQTGMPEFRFITLEAHGELIRVARRDAKYLLHQDAFLKSPRGEACRLLLELFGYGNDIVALRGA
jgi:ATP-dependent DNA helicase RecG